jgi:hypothetical protein
MRLPEVAIRVKHHDKKGASIDRGEELAATADLPRIQAVALGGANRVQTIRSHRRFQSLDAKATHLPPPVRERYSSPTAAAREPVHLEKQ